MVEWVAGVVGRERRGASGGDQVRREGLRAVVGRRRGRGGHGRCSWEWPARERLRGGGDGNGDRGKRREGRERIRVGACVVMGGGWMRGQVNDTTNAQACWCAGGSYIAPAHQHLLRRGYLRALVGWGLKVSTGARV